MPLTLDTWVTDSTRVRAVNASRNGAASSSGPDGRAGTDTRLTEKPKRAARTSHATLFVGWFWSQRTTSSPGESGMPALTVLLASLVLRTSATSSGSTPSCAAACARDSSRIPLNLARLLNEQSRSMSRVSSSTLSATTRGDGHRLAAFMGTRSSLKEKRARTCSQ